jgi:hypothetical protein
MDTVGWGSVSAGGVSRVKKRGDAVLFFRAGGRDGDGCLGRMGARVGEISGNVKRKEIHFARIFLKCVT